MRGLVGQPGDEGLVWACPGARGRTARGAGDRFRGAGAGRNSRSLRLRSGTDPCGARGQGPRLRNVEQGPPATFWLDDLSPGRSPPRYISRRTTVRAVCRVGWAGRWTLLLACLDVIAIPQFREFS